MNTRQVESWCIIGISVRTTNENNQAMQDIPLLWQQFMDQDIAEKIPNKIDQTLYCVYTDYEKDHTKPYTTIIGYKVSSLDDIPAGMIGWTIEAAEYQVFTSKGDITKGSVYHTWIEIWNTPMQRQYKADFEVYGAKATDLTNAEVEIFISV